MYCRECGKKIEDGSLSCIICGAMQNIPDTAAERSTTEQAETVPESESSIPRSPCCTFCGAPIESDSLFCILCGKRQPAPLHNDPTHPVEAATEKSLSWSHENKSNEPQAETLMAALHPAESAQPQPDAKSSTPEKLYCIHCGALLRDSALFCVKCGTRQDSDSLTTSNTPTYQEGHTREKRGNHLLILLGALLAGVLLCALLLPKVSKMLEDDPEAIIDVANGEFCTENETSTPIHFGHVVTSEPVQTKSPEAYDAQTTPMPEGSALELLSFSPEVKYVFLSPDMQQYLFIKDSFLDMCPVPSTGIIHRGFTIIHQDPSALDDPFYIILDSFEQPLQLISSDPPCLLEYTSSTYPEAKWWFPSFDNGTCHIHLEQCPDYALTRKGSKVTLDICDPSDPSQYWVIAPCEEIVTPSSHSFTENLEHFILSLAERTITINDLVGIDQETMGYVRNGIYAMAGKIFKTQKYQDYFSSTSWYVPYSQDSDLVSARFNQCMSHNLNVCIEYETLMGWR